MGKLDNENSAVLLSKALENPTGEGLESALLTFSQGIEQKVLVEAQAFVHDSKVMSQRSGMQLTTEEKDYFMEVISSGTAFAGVDKVVPPTIINRVFDNLTKNRPLLQKIDIVNTGLATEWIFSVGVNPAFWGALCDDIQELTDKGFRKVSISQNKLSAFMPVCKAFLELNSPEWLAQYVVTVLTEAIQIALEKAIVDGSKANEPVGMRRSLANVSSNVHAEIAATEISDLTPETMGEMMAELTSVDIGDGVTIDRTLAPSDVIMVVNPQTYWKKLYPKMTVQTSGGGYVTNLPIPFTIVESTEIPENELIVGRGKDYFFGLGMATKIGFSDEVRFIEDERVYLAKMYGNGQPKADGLFKRYTFTAE